MRGLLTLTDFRLLFHAAEKYEAGKDKYPCTCNSTQYIMQVSTVFTEYFKLCPWRPNIKPKTLNIACSGNKPKQIYTLQITQVSNAAKRHADNGGNHQTGDV